MKTTTYKKLLLLAALPALMLASCSKEEMEATDGLTPVAFTTAIQGIALPQSNGADGASPATRTAIDPTTGETVWKEGDAVGIFMVSAGGNVKDNCLPGADNKKYIVDPVTDKLNPADDTPLYFPRDGKVDFIAYYPYSPSGYDNSNGTLSFDGANQQDPAAIDLLWTKVSNADKSSAPVSLAFAHAMCKVTLHVKAGISITADEIKALTAQDVCIEKLSVGDFNIQTGKPAGGTPTTHDNVALYKSPAAGAGADATFSAIVAPGLQGNALGITFRIGGKEYRCTLPDADGFLAGQHLVYPVTVRETGIEVGVPVTDVPWTEGELPTVTIGDKTFRLIRNADDLKRYADDVNNGQRDLNAIQTADIDLSGISNWVPINSSRYSLEAPSFTGIYNGNGHTITGLKITDIDAAFCGLFGMISSGALLTGIHLRNADINTRSLYSGTLVGEVDGGIVSLCSAEGKIVAKSEIYLCVGGLVGYNNGTITRSRTNVSVEADATVVGQLSAYAGGITGCNAENGLLFACHATGDVTLTGRHEDTVNGNLFFAGGIIGYTFLQTSGSSSAYCCVAEGDVSVSCETPGIGVYAGGLIGFHHMNSTLKCSYARGTAEAQGAAESNARVGAGAIVGHKFNETSVISNCYGTGAVGQGTSNLNAVTENIVYDTNPGEGAIYNIIAPNGISLPDIPFTDYSSSATPAYGIDVKNRSVSVADFWINNGIWPTPDFTYNATTNP